MRLRLGEWLVLVGAGVIVLFAILIGVLIYMKPPPVRYVYVESPLSKRGEAIFRRENCFSCHEVFGNGATYGPKLDGVGSRRTKRWLMAYLQEPRPGVSEKPYRSKMPSYANLQTAELEALAAYLLGLQERNIASAPTSSAS